MKQLYKSALLAVLGLAGVTAAQASTDLFIGFNDNAGPTSAQNDYVIDIGSFATLQADALAAPNYTVNLSSLFIPSTFSTAFSSDPNEASDVAAGVAGGQTSTNPKQLWQTAPVGITPVSISGSALQTAANQPQTLVAGEYASTTQNSSWTWLVAQSPTLPGTEPSGSVASSTHTNPMGLLGIGVYPNLILNLWQDTRLTATSPGSTGWVDEGYFTFDLQDNSVTYTVPVPEPGFYGLVAGAGLLVLALRRQFVSKIA
jgi:hypothetical protein